MKRILLYSSIMAYSILFSHYSYSMMGGYYSPYYGKVYMPSLSWFPEPILEETLTDFQNMDKHNRAKSILSQLLYFLKRDLSNTKSTLALSGPIYRPKGSPLVSDCPQDPQTKYLKSMISLYALYINAVQYALDCIEEKERE
ncbi:MAG TPA: hypothetical protein VGW78_00875 [Candidatus Babeliales bacterium]|nr:hypothetical protein [Candidatus Babeliales bacterium]